MNPRPLDVLFVGDSITEYWQSDAPEVWQQEFGRLRCVNLGVAGDTTSDVLERMMTARLEQLAPKVTVLLIGTNDISLNDGTPHEIAGRTKLILQILQEKMPQTKVLLIGVLPREYSPHSPVRDTIRQVNDELSTFEDAKSVSYLDISAGYLDENGIIPLALMPDSLHLSDEGYSVWATEMRDTLKTLLES